jgi:uncharacterized membrane protein YeaQ/YmgE (transglycosylase-associated protein family)
MCDTERTAARNACYSRIQGNRRNGYVGNSFMDLFVFAMLGGSVGWAAARMMWVTQGALTVILNVLAGICGALLAGCLVVPLLASPVQSDFTVAISPVLLGAAALVTMVTFLRATAR